MMTNFLAILSGLSYVEDPMDIDSLQATANDIYDQTSTNGLLIPFYPKKIVD